MKRLADISGSGDPSGNGHGPDRPRSFHWRRYQRFLKKWWWIPALAGFIGAGLQAFLLFREPPQFASNARMWVSGKLQLPEGRLYQEEVQNFFGTQMALMQGPRLTERAHSVARAAYPDRPPSRVELNITPLPRTSILVLRAVGPDPNYVQLFLNALMDEYLRAKRGFRRQTTEEALAAAKNDLMQKQHDLELEQEKLERMKKENDVVVLQAQGDAAGSRLSQLNIQREDLVRELLLLDGEPGADRGLGAKATPTNPVPAAAHSSAEADLPDDSRTSQELFSILQQMQTLKLLRDDLSVNLRPRHPKMIKLNEDLGRLEKLVEFYRQRSQEEAAAGRQRLERKIQLIEQSITNWEAKALEASLRLADYERSRANVQRLQTICDDLTKTVQKVELDQQLAQETLTKLDEGGASIGVPIPKPWARKIAVGLAVGLAVGALVVYLIDRFDDRVVPSTNLSGEFALGIVGRVPEVKMLQFPDKPRALPRLRDRQLFDESYRNLRSSLLFMPTRDRRPKTIVVTSAVPYEGKSTVTQYLAETLAQAGCRVLLIDGDLRRGQMQKSFQLPSEPGLSDLLQGRATPLETVLPTAQDRLFLLPVGSPVASPGELFLTSRLETALKELAEDFDFVLIDTPPILATDDTTSLAPKTDGVLFVVRESFSKAGLIRPALDQLLQRQARILGLIVNRADSSSKEYCYYKYSQYYGST